MHDLRLRGLLRGLLLSSLFVLSGCLPYSCRPDANEALFPADSLSRRVAQDTPADTLRQTATLTGPQAHRLAYPRTVRFWQDGQVAASDAKRNSLFLFGRDGTFRRELADSAFAVPYLIGVRSDTLVVFNAEADRVDVVTRDGRSPDRSVAYERPAPETLVYMLATDTGLYAKTVGQETGASLARLGETGTPVAQIELGGAYWRHAGFLRQWDDQLLSLSGFRPTVRRLPLSFSAGARPDSLSLVGFNSPMLERSYAYSTGDVSNPPLLTASAAPAGDTLFVLNLRPGWVQIDAYDRQGRLQRRLVEPHDAGDSNFYPVDLDVRRTPDGYAFAVAVRSPEPQVELFRWSPTGK
jgi:hypothetical protein